MKFIRMEREVPCTKRGRLSYRWTTGCLQVDGTKKIYPPVSYREARSLSKGQKFEVVEESDLSKTK